LLLLLLLLSRVLVVPGRFDLPTAHHLVCV